MARVVTGRPLDHLPIVPRRASGDMARRSEFKLKLAGTEENKLKLEL
jgi:hypothetical protein